ncbi:MAG: xanthine dehydrogenase family protein molybdopterin-binding subunit [Candidatus Hodarchaeales archaeon]
MVLKYVGKAIKRADALEKVTGAAQFIDDLRFPRMLYVKVLRAGIPHAKILKIDTSEAKKIEGVIEVLTGKSEVFESSKLIGTCIFDQTPIAKDKVRHAGEVVAAVIAENEKIASEAVENIKVDYEPLPFVIDPIEAASKNAPVIHEKNGEYEHVPTFVPVKNTNIFYKYQLKKGDHANVFKEADVTVESDFEYPLLSHAALEPHGAVAHWDLCGELHIWSSTQAPFVLREVMNHLFELPMNKIHVNVPSYLGGGFGGKSDYTIEPLLAYLAKAVPGYYLKFVLTRKEVFIGSVLGRGMKGYMKIGAKNDGTLVGIEADLYFSDGAYGDTGCNVVLAAGHNCVGPYYFRNCSIRSHGVYTNTPPVGAFRGYGHPEGQFMIERLMEQLALKLHIDSKELRNKNFLRPGQTNSLGQTITEHNGNIRECFSKVIEALEKEPLPKEDENYIYGRGIAALVKSPVQTANASSNVVLKVNEDLTVNISVGGVEIGQGSLTVLAQIAADYLQFPVENIRINNEINTQLTPYEWQTVASMSTMRIGNAIKMAAERAIHQFKENAAQVLNCDLKDLVYDGTKISYDKTEIPLEKLAMGYQYEDGHTIGDPIITTGSSVVRNVTWPDLETGQYQPYEWTFGSQGVDIQINRKTGEVKVLRAVTALDVGKVINPATAEGQIMGGFMQGIGAALMEKIEFNEKGIMKTTNLRRYRIPRLSDMPEFTCIFVENPQPDGPFGCRPMAEHPIIGPPPAIMNAIQKATGISINTLPATPDKIKDVLEKRG